MKSFGLWAGLAGMLGFGKRIGDTKEAHINRVPEQGLTLPGPDPLMSAPVMMGRPNYTSASYKLKLKRKL